MAELDLPRGPAELLEAVRGPIADHLGGEGRIRFGGGTALAARWSHRRSTDVDLFVDYAAYRPLFRNSHRFIDDVERHSGPIEQIGVGRAYAVIALRDSEVNILATDPITDSPVSSDTVRGTRIAVVNNAEILAGKLVHRLAEYHIFVSRDLYDVAVARRLDPAALDVALASVPAPSLHDVRRALALLEPGWAERDPKPLLDPVHDREAENSVAIVRREIGRHLDARERRGRSRDPGPER